jgi:hypothetical protein
MLCLVIPFLLPYAYLKTKQSVLKKQFKARMAGSAGNDELVTLKFSKNQASQWLNWEKDDEFEFESQMYDVVEKTSSADSVSFTCWKDDEESKLKRQMKSFVARALDRDPGNNCNQFLIAKFIKTLYCDPGKRTEIYKNPVKQLFSDFKGCDILNPKASPPTPPPEFIG